MSAATLIQAQHFGDVDRDCERSRSDATPRVYRPEDADAARTANEPCPWDDREFERAPRAMLRRILLEVPRDPDRRGLMTQRLFPMLVKGPPARRRLVYETLREFAEPQEILIGSLQLHLRDGDVEPLVIGAGLLEDLGPRSWPVLAAYARRAPSQCAYFVPAIARLKGVAAEKRWALLEILARSEDSELRSRACEALEGIQLVDMIRIRVPGKTDYPLRHPISLKIAPGFSGIVVKPAEGEVRDLPTGFGPTLEAAIEDFGHRFDRLIQENRAIPPHVRTPENDRIVGILDDLVDWERYEQENPLGQPMWGQVRERRADGSLRIYWVIGPNGADDQETVLHRRDVHPSLAAIPVGRWFYGAARSYPDRIEWVDDAEEVPDPNDPEARRALWESLPKEPADQPNCWPLKRS